MKGMTGWSYLLRVTRTPDDPGEWVPPYACDQCDDEGRCTLGCVLSTEHRFINGRWELLEEEPS